MALFNQPKAGIHKSFVSLAIPPQLLIDVSTVAKLEGVSRSEAIRSLIKLGIVHYGKGIQ
jgi:metal-responsive CopG/Arc/MetJ family transcriptional regulator